MFADDKVDVIRQDGACIAGVGPAPNDLAQALGNLLLRVLVKTYYRILKLRLCGIVELANGATRRLNGTAARMRLAQLSDRGRVNGSRPAPPRIIGQPSATVGPNKMISNDAHRGDCKSPGPNRKPPPTHNIA